MTHAITQIPSYLDYFLIDNNNHTGKARAFYFQEKEIYEQNSNVVSSYSASNYEVIKELSWPPLITCLCSLKELPSNFINIDLEET